MHHGPTNTTIPMPDLQHSLTIMSRKKRKTTSQRSYRRTRGNRSVHHGIEKEAMHRLWLARGVQVP